MTKKTDDEPMDTPRDREEVLGDFRKIVGPLRGQNQDRKASQEADAQDRFKRQPEKADS